MALATRWSFFFSVIILQIIFVILFATLTEYDDAASPKWNKQEADMKDPVGHYYPMFQDVHVMIFVGFGFLMVFLRRYGFSSVGLNMLISAIAIQWATIFKGLLHEKGETIHLGIFNMLDADFACAAVLITFGALLGKTSPLQMVVITILEIIIFGANEYIGLEYLKVQDVGGSMFVHAFGAYFGLAVSRVIYREEMGGSNKEGSVYHSDMFAMVGTLFLWMFWPSFNSALAVEDAQHRAVLNTYLALAACCVTAFAFSCMVDEKGKFDMVHVQNATLAGGVAVGTSADMMIHPHGALIIGVVAGALSVVGYKYITPFLSSKLKIHDTCGVNNLHGMPAILAGICGAIMASMADKDTYKDTLYRQFPAMAPNTNTTTGDNRSAGEQAGYQAAALIMTLAMAVVGGLIVGVIIRFGTFLGQPHGPQLYEDEVSWEVPDNSDVKDVVNEVLAELEKRGNGHSSFEQKPSPEEKENQNYDVDPSIVARM